MSRILTPQQKIERSIVTVFRRDIWNKFVMGYERYDMIKPGDKIAVCISGGKDSMLLAKCMQHLQKYQGMDIGLEFIVMNPGYSDANRQRIIDNAKLMGIPIKMFETKVFDIAYNTKRNPCYLCARMRRGWLYKFAQDAPALELKGGVVEGTAYDVAGISELAKIPSRDELLSKLLGSLQSPITNFARVIKQIAEQGGEAAPAEAAEETATDAE